MLANQLKIKANKFEFHKTKIRRDKRVIYIEQSVCIIKLPPYILTILNLRSTSGVGCTGSVWSKLRVCTKMCSSCKQNLSLYGGCHFYFHNRKLNLTHPQIIFSHFTNKSFLVHSLQGIVVKSNQTRWRWVIKISNFSIYPLPLLQYWSTFIILFPVSFFAVTIVI